MKYLTLIFLASTLWACPKGTTDWQGTCAADLQPKDTVPVPEVKPSEEKPPSDKMPSYQREGIKADMGTLADNSTTTAHNYQAERDQK